MILKKLLERNVGMHVMFDVCVGDNIASYSGVVKKDEEYGLCLFTKRTYVKVQIAGLDPRTQKPIWIKDAAPESLTIIGDDLIVRDPIRFTIVSETAEEAESLLEGKLSLAKANIVVPETRFV
jgi:hypothetical protein